ncbi:cbb3-type cytochrome c oxidase subunit I [Flavobacterium plurextorum]|uniref:cbb3-type cytochrome c oxidase subunit I n=1 Tax=Flavobacterium TaxID=237 RepID=UPI00214DEA8D|nr:MULTISPECIES: cbb3-type cytochrome c oxidase subunit I [Flavobacterium]UUW08870.1 cbb3-type cytochrome c oxidase subunit I [Flavobacterium plurextorum]
MNFKKIKVYHLFWIVSLLILIIGFLQNNDNPTSNLDINIHDTYYVVRNFDSTIFLFICYFIMGFGYWLVQKVFKKQLVKSLTILHSLIFIGSFVIYWIALIYGKLFLQKPEFPSFLNDYQLLNSTLVLELLVITFVGIPVYVINLLIGLIRKK